MYIYSLFIGLDIREVAHKSVAKSLKKITEGPIRGRGVSWFPELVDKRKYHNFL